MKNISSCRFAPVLRALLFGLSTVFVSALASGEVQPATASPSSPSATTPNWSATGSLIEDRYSQTATLLTNGKVLVTGGYSGFGGTNFKLRTAELYDPATGVWRATGQLTAFRADHTATLLPNGKVLVVGGGPSTAELYDPAAGTWTLTGAPVTPRSGHTATLLQNGKVLVVGGFSSSAELYDPALGTWTTTGTLATGRGYHTATLLPNGKVLVAGGVNNAASLNSSELYDPVAGTWSPTGSLASARGQHTATLLPSGKVLVAAGSNSASLSSAEVYDPALGTWSATGPLVNGRQLHSATLLPNGKVLVSGGSNSGLVTIANLYDPATGTWSATSALANGRSFFTAILLPNGKVMAVGGIASNGLSTKSAELYDWAAGTWSATGALAPARSIHTATLLTDGKVVVVGGFNSANGLLSSAQVYDPAAGTWSTKGSLKIARSDHTATLLANGKVLVAGGNTLGVTNTAELYDPVAGTWSTTGALANARYQHTATLLPNGKVLVVGGSAGGGSSAELYDPTSGTWSPTGALASARFGHTATLLPNGKVLVAGGANTTALTTSELYDPALGTWSMSGAATTPRAYHTATLLPNGKVLVAGGQNGPPEPVISAELYDPVAGTWTTTAPLASARFDHTATLLSDGKVLVVGGYDNSTYRNTAELYDPAAGTWTTAAALTTARTKHTATFLLNGKVLVAGGQNGLVVSSAELYDVGLAFLPAWQPQLTGVPSYIPPDAQLTVTGSRFKGISQASGGGSQDSSTNYPLVQLRRLDSEQVVFLSVDPMNPWSDTAFTSAPALGFPYGPAQVTVFTNGIPSASSYLLVRGPVSQPLNISTRMEVLGNDNVLIAGLIVTGDPGVTKKVMVRGLGPSLAAAGVQNALSDPFLELHGPAGFTTIMNDNWADASNANQIPDGFQPANSREAVIIATLTVGPNGFSSYTAIVRGANGETGIGLAEVYDLEPSTSQLANISTRGFVDRGDNVMIGGFILGGSTQANKIIVRAIGPSLASSGITNALANPVLELHDGNGTTIQINDDWKINPATGQSQEAAIRATTLQPSNDLESAIVTLLAPGAYTAILSGKDSTTGVGLVELYNLP